jgi:hypothetical protein
MTGQHISYIRVSTRDQNPDRHLENIPVDRIFTDHASGMDIAPSARLPPALRAGGGIPSSWIPWTVSPGISTTCDASSSGQAA